ncbi:uncharacterized protein [Spinacia oleracea]|uniref:J domain-containing protein n=1 Tax=Spinacia oleracea TaxID=3562 RepID=A0ABM3QXC5_SPIOL|nr:uncharacterized protein LOC130463011 [Spinacia oleracea]
MSSTVVAPPLRASSLLLSLSSSFRVAPPSPTAVDLYLLQDQTNSVVYSWVGDDPCGDGDYRVVTGLEVYAVSIVGLFPIAVTNLLDLQRLASDVYSYHKLAKEYHPDTNKNNPSAKRTFQEIKDAYENLFNVENDPVKKKYF